MWDSESRTEKYIFSVFTVTFWCFVFCDRFAKSHVVGTLSHLPVRSVCLALDTIDESDRVLSCP